jgi:hypothetical protein
MSKPSIGIVIGDDDFDHLIRGGEVRINTDVASVRVAFSDIGWDVMQQLIQQARLDRATRLGKIHERKPR